MELKVGFIGQPLKFKLRHPNGDSLKSNLEQKSSETEF